MKFAWSNVDKFEEADIIIVGVPDESGSHSTRKSTSKAPNRIRQMSNERDVFIRQGMKTLAMPELDTSTKKVFDFGNISKDEIGDVMKQIVYAGKIPLLIGGDHSITTKAVNATSEVINDIGVVYFDAHPDFICSSKEYYGSVFCDISESINASNSMQIGIRAPEPEEIQNLKRMNITVFTPLDVLDIGLRNVADLVVKKMSKNVYISLDMDCIDPAFAPGVSAPVPAGLSSNEIIYLLKAIANNGIIGMDLMEVCPDYDVNDSTSHLAARVIAEVISSIMMKKDLRART
ncbi:MAG: agmatinase [Nitrososphaerales archaeon]